MKMVLAAALLLLVAAACAPPSPEPTSQGAEVAEEERNAFHPEAKEQPTPTEQHALEQQPADAHQPSAGYWSPLFTKLEGCEEKDVVFTAAPLELDTIIAVEPQGELTDITSGHITPGDHVGFQYPEGSVHKVYAIGDGVLKRAERNQNFFNARGSGAKNYHLYFEYSCSVFGSYVHVTALDPALLAADGTLRALDAIPEADYEGGRNINVNIPVTAGQVLGTTTAYGLLGMLTVDTRVTLAGFAVPETYEGEPWKIHAVPPFGYFAEPLRSRLLAKNPRTKEPRGGKIDFDADGRLSGNWFLEGTDYRGATEQAFCGDYLCPYWEGHLAFVHDFIDPDQIRVSIGYDSGIEVRGPYGVKGNAPDSALVSSEDGIVRYELVALDDIGSQFGYVTIGKPLYTLSSERVVGTLLAQLADGRTLKMEVFPGKAASSVGGFTHAARVYTR